MVYLLISQLMKVTTVIAMKHIYAAAGITSHPPPSVEEWPGSVKKIAHPKIPNMMVRKRFPCL